MPKVTLICHTPEPERLVAAAARLCYSSAGIDELREGMTAEKTESFVSMLAELGHESPTEHVSFTFGIEGVSRALLAQITRHRLASYSVQSQRYVSKSNFASITPPEIAADEKTAALFTNAMEAAGQYYDRIAGILKETYTDRYLAEGKTRWEAERLAEKKANEDARFVLPNACDTKLMMTINARSLMNFFRYRCCHRAQWEIRELAEEMLRLVLPVAPHLFAKAGPPCLSGSCAEGKMACGQIQEVRQHYAGLAAEAARNPSAGQRESEKTREEAVCL